MTRTATNTISQALEMSKDMLGFDLREVLASFAGGKDNDKLPTDVETSATDGWAAGEAEGRLDNIGKF